jgi:SAM-dependent methyltransferase
MGYSVPERYTSSFVCWGGAAEVQYIYKTLLGDLAPGGRVLIVGVMGGRDYFLFKNLGCEVTALDLGPQPDIDPIVFANVENDLPFPDKHFDAVIIGEVLEHLKYDARALDNLRRILKDSGQLLVSIPFYNDSEEGHMRIHSPESGRRLFKISGFRVVDYLERPAFFWCRTLQNLVLHGISLLTWLFTRKTAYKWETAFVGRFEWSVGHLAWPRVVRRLTSAYGGYYLCEKDHPMDHVSLNRSLYTTATLGVKV